MVRPTTNLEKQNNHYEKVHRTIYKLMNEIDLSVYLIRILIVSILFLVFRFGKWTTALLFLQRISQAKSQTPPSFIYKGRTSEPTDTSPFENFLKSEFGWIHASVLLSITVIILLIIIFVIIYKKKANLESTFIALEITTGGSCVMVPILKLSLCPSYWKITTPTIRQLSLSTLSTRKLFATWDKFYITNRLTSQSIQVPSTISIDIFTWRKLKTILKQPFCAYVLVVHHGHSSVLPGQDFMQEEQTPAHLYPQL